MQARLSMPASKLKAHYDAIVVGSGYGGGVAAARLARCHPWADGGVDDVPPHKNFRHALTRHGFVVPAPTGKD